MFPAPLVSVVMPVFNGADLVERALESLRRQSLTQWEALAVNDGSTDGTAAVLDKWAAADSRVRVFHHPENRGLSAARNTALAAAQAEMVAYLDHDDEFYPDHLARVHALRGGGDVLLFRYDLVEERAGHPKLGKRYTHDPAACFHAMHTTSIAVPLGVAHHRALLAQSGYFDELLGRYQGQDEDADLWRRFVKAGAKFVAVQAKSGLYHIRGNSLVRTRPPAPGASTATQPVDVVRGTEKHTLILPSADVGIVDQIFRDGKYAGLSLDKLNRPPVVLDVGAHCGTFALFAKLALHRDAVIHCFEPNSSHIELLTKNLAAFPGVTVHGFGLGSIDADRIRDAADVWDELGLTEVDVLKLAAEGAEADILESLGERLRRVRVVLAEFHTAADRRRIDALLPGHELFAATLRSHQVGVVQYLRADRLDPPSEPTIVPPAEPTIVPPAGPFSDDAWRGAGAGLPRVLFASYHCYRDPASGAALCTRDLFAALAARQWACAVVTGGRLDDPRAVPVRLALRDRPGVHTAGAVLSWVESAGYPVAVIAPDPPVAARPPTPADVTAFADAVARAISVFRPDVLLTYGGDAASRAARRVARAAGAKVVFWLHNFAYPHRGEFSDCDAVVVPSEFSRRHYQETVGLACVSLPPPIDPARVVADRPDGGRFVTLVNPEPGKGGVWVAGLADTLGRCRPDIPFLVVEGRGRAGGLAGVGSVRVMANTPDPRRFYRLSRLLLVPSVAAEPFGRVAAEALMNGIPVITSDRGGIPETVGGGGVVLPLPSSFTAATRTPPAAEEMAPWVDMIVRLWDDPAAYRRASETARQWAERWQPETVVKTWEAFLSEIARPG